MSETSLADLIIRQPPHSREAEVGVLGATLRDESVLPDVLARLSVEDFHLDAHQRIYRAIRRLTDAGSPVDTVTLFEELVRSNELAEVGGAVYLAELWDATPTAANWEYYAAAVRETAALRAVIYHGTEAVRDAYDRIGEASEIVARLTAAVEAAVTDRSAGDPIRADVAVAEGIADYERRNDPAAIHHWTGFVDLDRFVPGFEPGQLIVVGARPGKGKTALGLAFALHAAHGCGRSAYVASLEMSRTELGKRLAVMLTDQSGHRLQSGRATADELLTVGRARQLIAGNPLFVDDTPAQRVGQIAAQARRVKRKYGLGLVIVDYLQLVAPDERRADRREQVEQISRGLKALARQLRVPVIAPAQLNREVEGRPGGRPRLSDLKETGGIEADADVVLMLWWHADQAADAAVVRVGCAVEKQRNGPTGEITLAYRRSCARFENYAAGNPIPD